MKSVVWFGLVDWCLTTLSAQTGYIVLQEYEIYYAGPGDKINSTQLNNTINQENHKYSSAWVLWRGSPRHD